MRVRILPQIRSKFRPGWLVEVAIEAMDAELEEFVDREGQDIDHINELLAGQ